MQGRSRAFVRFLVVLGLVLMHLAVSVLQLYTPFKLKVPTYARFSDSLPLLGARSLWDWGGLF